MPKLMFIHLVYYTVMWLNSIPPEHGVSSTMSPWFIIIGRVLEYKHHCELPFGSYVQTIEEPSKKNVIHESRTMGEISLVPDNYESGGYHFISLVTGKRIHRRSLKEFPIPSEEITSLENIGGSQGIQFMSSEFDYNRDTDIEEK